jgi:phosphoenolpyruvate-protein kinase (PTS system EI component)
LARELGIPAVLNLPGASAALHDKTITVDGTTGTVVIEEQERSDG